MVKHLFKAAVVLTLLLTLYACEINNSKLVTKEYDEQFEGIETIEVEGAYLEFFYEGLDNLQNVTLSAYLEFSEDLELDIKYRQNGSKLKIEVVNNESFNGFFKAKRTQGFLSLKGPKNINLDIQSSSGIIDVQAVNHEKINLKVNSGFINVNNLNIDDALLMASSGKIEGNDLAGEYDCKVNSGSIELKNINGNINANASSGTLKFENVNGIVSAKANSGTIKLSGVREIAKIKLSSGIAKIKDSGFGSQSFFQANSGILDIQTFSNLNDYNFDLHAGSGNLRVGDRKSNDELFIKNNADVTIKGKISSGSLKIYN